MSQDKSVGVATVVDDMVIARDPSKVEYVITHLKTRFAARSSDTCSIYANRHNTLVTWAVSTYALGRTEFS